MIAWYPGDGYANDIAGAHNGTLQNGATFAPDKVGQAFSSIFLEMPTRGGLGPVPA